MKKIFLIGFFACLLAAGIIVSCSQNFSRITGVWQASIKLKSNLLLNPQDEKSLIGYMYVKQHIEYNFKKDGRFTKRVVQKLDAFEFDKNKGYFLEYSEGDDSSCFAETENHFYFVGNDLYISDIKYSRVESNADM